MVEARYGEPRVTKRAADVLSVRCRYRSRNNQSPSPPPPPSHPFSSSSFGFRNGSARYEFLFSIISRPCSAGKHVASLVPPDRSARVCPRIKSNCRCTERGNPAGRRQLGPGGVKQTWCLVELDQSSCQTTGFNRSVKRDDRGVTSEPYAGNPRRS